MIDVSERPPAFSSPRVVTNDNEPLRLPPLSPQIFGWTQYPRPDIQPAGHCCYMDSGPVVTQRPAAPNSRSTESNPASHRHQPWLPSFMVVPSSVAKTVSCGLPLSCSFAGSGSSTYGLASSSCVTSSSHGIASSCGIPSSHGISSCSVASSHSMASSCDVPSAHIVSSHGMVSCGIPSSGVSYGMISYHSMASSCDVSSSQGIASSYGMASSSAMASSGAMASYHGVAGSNRMDSSHDMDSSLGMSPSPGMATSCGLGSSHRISSHAHQLSNITEFKAELSQVSTDTSTRLTASSSPCITVPNRGLLACQNRKCACPESAHGTTGKFVTIISY